MRLRKGPTLHVPTLRDPIMTEHAGGAFLSMVMFSALWLFTYTGLKIRDKIANRRRRDWDN